MRPPSLRARALFASATLALVTAGPASAHVQVTPSVVAPEDGVLFTVLVPNEREDATTSVELKIPDGAIPYSFDDPPGWKHKLILKPNKAVDRVRWTGSLPVGGFVRLAFLAGTPDRPGTLAWKAIQTYQDGTTVRWIGSPDSDFPASVTTVAKTALKQGAGGEVGSGGPTSPASAPTSAPAVAGTATRTITKHETDWLARILSILALIGVGAVVATRRAKPTT